MFNVTVAQFTPVLGNKKNNLIKMKSMMKEAKKQGSQLIIFPELSLTGYFISDKLHQIAETLEGDSINELREACKELIIHAVVSFPEKNEKGGIYNSAALIDDKGDIIGVYRKTHLFDNEKTIFEKGNELPVFDTKFGKIGIMICYDLEFPEVARSLRLNGAQAIFVPLANMKPYEDYQFTYLKSRAMENEIPVVLCNRTGVENGVTFFGESAVADAFGNILLKMDNEEQIETVTIHLKENKDKKLNYFANRQVDLYSNIVKSV